MPSPLILFILSAIVFAPLCSWLALQRGRSWAAWFVLGTLLGPLAAGLLYLAPPGQCPSCAGGITGWPRTCPHCAEPLDGSTTAVRAPAGPDGGVALAAASPEPDVSESGSTMLATGLYVGGTGRLQIGSRYFLARVGNQLQVLGPMESTPVEVRLRTDLPFGVVTLVGDGLVMDDGGATDRKLLFAGVVAQRDVDLEAVLRGSHTERSSGAAVGATVVTPGSPPPTPVDVVRPPVEPTTGFRASALASPVGIGAILVVGLAGAVLGWQILAGLGGPAQPSATIAPSPTRSAAATTAAATTPPAIRAALTTALLIGQRLMDGSAALEAAINPPEPSEIASILRAMNADLVTGRAAAVRLQSDEATAELGTDLLALYDAVLERNDETLGASVRNADTYVEGATAVIALLTAVPALDDRIADALAGRVAPTTPPSAGASNVPTDPPPTPGLSPTPVPSVTRPSASPTAGASSLVRNPSFEEGTTGWNLQIVLPAAATFTLDPNGREGSTSARIDIGAGSPSRAGIALLADPFDLVPGRTYRVEVALRAESARDVRIRLIDGDGQTITARIETVGPAWSVAAFTTTTLIRGTDVRLAVDLGRATETVWVDDVLVVAAPN